MFRMRGINDKIIRYENYEKDVKLNLVMFVMAIKQLEELSTDDIKNWIAEITGENISKLREDKDEMTTTEQIETYCAKYMGNEKMIKITEAFEIRKQTNGIKELKEEIMTNKHVMHMNE